MIAAPRRFALALILGICLISVSPAVALAAGSPSSAAKSAFGIGLPQSTPPTTTQTQTQAVTPVVTTASSGGSISGTDALLVALGAVVILAGIAYFIWKDSRQHARALHGAGADTAAGNGASRGSKAPPKSRKLKPAERRRRKRGRARAR